MSKPLSKADLCDIIEEKYGKSEFRSLVRSEGDGVDKFKELTGLDFEFIDSWRSEGSGDYDGYTWLWKVGEGYYQHEGYYCSHSGTEFPSALDFDRVVPTEVVTTVYKVVKD